MLHEFLSSNRAAIVERSRAKVAARPPGANPDEVANGIPEFLDQLIEALMSTPAPSAAIARSATEHGRSLLKRGRTVAQVVHEYGALCQAVTELADETRASITASEFQTFNACLDDAIAQAVTEFTQQRERTIAKAGTARSGELAHELRNALGSAMLAFESILAGSVGLRGSTAALLGRSLRRLGDLIDSSLAQVRLEAGVHARERIALRAFLEEAGVGATLEAAARGLHFAGVHCDPGVEVEADGQLLAAALGNLLQNAFKFTRPFGHVSLRSSATSDLVTISVEDECGGLPKGDAAELFESFEQRGSDRRGLGLGLSISRTIVEAEGGRIEVHDKPGVGCVFSIVLPRLPPQGPDSPARRGP